jgi:hypothetical protein
MSTKKQQQEWCIKQYYNRKAIEKLRNTKKHTPTPRNAGVYGTWICVCGCTNHWHERYCVACSSSREDRRVIID